MRILGRRLVQGGYGNSMNRGFEVGKFGQIWRMVSSCVVVLFGRFWGEDERERCRKMWGYIYFYFGVIFVFQVQVFCCIFYLGFGWVFIYFFFIEFQFWGNSFFLDFLARSMKRVQFFFFCWFQGIAIFLLRFLDLQFIFSDVWFYFVL